MLPRGRCFQGEAVTAPYYTWDFTITFTLTGCWEIFFPTTNKEARGWVWEENYRDRNNIHPWKERLQEKDGWDGSGATHTWTRSLHGGPRCLSLTFPPQLGRKAIEGKG